MIAVIVMIYVVILCGILLQGMFRGSDPLPTFVVGLLWPVWVLVVAAVLVAILVALSVSWIFAGDDE